MILCFCNFLSGNFCSYLDDQLRRVFAFSGNWSLCLHCFVVIQFFITTAVVFRLREISQNFRKISGSIKFPENIPAYTCQCHVYRVGLISDDNTIVQPSDSARHDSALTIGLVVFLGVIIFLCLLLGVCLHYRHYQLRPSPGQLSL